MTIFKLVGGGNDVNGMVGNECGRGIVLVKMTFGGSGNADGKKDKWVNGKMGKKDGRVKQTQTLA